MSFGVAVPSILGKAVIASAAENFSLSPSGKTVVVVQLAGGYDGLNMIVPYTDANYRRMRPSLGVPEADVLQIDERVGFNPAMAKLKELFDAGNAPIVTLGALACSTGHHAPLGNGGGGALLLPVLSGVLSPLWP